MSKLISKRETLATDIALGSFNVDEAGLDAYGKISVWVMAATLAVGTYDIVISYSLDGVNWIDASLGDTAIADNNPRVYVMPATVLFLHTRVAIVRNASMTGTVDVTVIGIEN
jgi:succinyl-CoA synthetase beta subunit